MTRSPSFHVPIYLPAVALGLAGAVFIGFSALAKPHDLAVHTAKIDAQLVRAADLEARSGDPGRWPAGAVCREAPDAGATAYGQRLAQWAQASKVMVVDMKVAPSDDTTQSELTAVSVRLKARGDQSAVLTLLANLAHDTPVLFVDAVDLKPGATGETLDLTGRIWCWRTF